MSDKNETFFQLKIMKLAHESHFAWGLTHYEWNLHSQLFYWEMRKSVIFWLSPRFWTKIQNQLFFILEANLSKTNDTVRTAQACWFQKWSIFWKLVEKWVQGPPDPQLAPHGLKKFPSIFGKPLGGQTLHLGKWRHAVLRKWCTFQISGPQGGPNGGQGGQMGSKNKVWLKMLKIA